MHLTMNNDIHYSFMYIQRVWSVAFNKFHDQLLLSSGSDTLVNLHNVVSVSSASYLRSNSSDSNEDKQAGQGDEDDEDGWGRLVLLQ